MTALSSSPNPAPAPPAAVHRRATATSTLYRWLVVLLAVSYGLGLASLPIDVFADRSNYLSYAQSSPLIVFDVLQGGLFALLANEPIWLAINALLSLWMEPEQILRGIIFVGATSVAHVVLRRGPKHFIWLLLILVFPGVIKNYIIHLRQGLAIAVFMVGWHATGTKKKVLLYAMTPLIHASFFVILALLALAYVARRLRFAVDVRTVAYLLAGLGMAFSLHTVALLLNARQAQQYTFKAEEISGLGFVFWLLVLAIFVIEKREFLRQHSFALGAIILYLSSYFFNELAGRIFESALVVVLLAGLSLSGWRRQLYCAAILSYGAIDWILRLNQPAVGFGAA